MTAQPRRAEFPLGAPSEAELIDADSLLDSVQAHTETARMILGYVGRVCDCGAPLFDEERFQYVEVAWRIQEVGIATLRRLIELARERGAS